VPPVALAAALHTHGGFPLFPGDVAHPGTPCPSVLMFIPPSPPLALFSVLIFLERDLFFCVLSDLPDFGFSLQEFFRDFHYLFSLLRGSIFLLPEEIVSVI